MTSRSLFSMNRESQSPFLKLCNPAIIAPSRGEPNTMNVEQLYVKYGPMVHRRCMRLLGNSEEAYEVMQDVFVRVIRREKHLDLTAPSSLLYKIATDLCLNKLRTRKRKPETYDETLLLSIATDDDIESLVQNRSLLDRIFAREPKSTRTIAVLHYVDKMTLEEVAAVMNMSVSGIRKRLRILKENGRNFEEKVA